MATLKITSPKGITSYPYLHRADTEFKEGGEFKTGLKVPKELAQGLINDIEKQIMVCANEIAEKSKASGKSLDPKKIAAKLKRPYAEDEEDEDIIVFKFSQNAVIPSTGKAVVLRFFDAKGKTIASEDVPAIYGGSVVRISGGARTYAAGANKGVTLDIYAVQIIELVTGTQSGGGSADDYGFGEEEGFAHETDAEAAGFTDSLDDDSYDDDEDVDF